MTIAEIATRLRSREISCVELIRKTFDDIATGDRFNSFITLTPESAHRQAEERDAEFARGMDRGLLHGIPFAAKDLLYTNGVRTTGASRLFADFIPESDAEVLIRLRDAGAILVGKTNLHELAFGATSQSEHFGPVLNPHDTERIPGGSSGGSASVVAAGLVPMALGTDTGGSIRIPASYCGVVGFKPTYGLVSRRGVLPLAFSLDHVGPLGATVQDCAITMRAIAPAMQLSPKRQLNGVRVLVPENFFFDRVDAEVSAAVRAAISRIEQTGAIVSSERIPDLHEANVAARIVQLGEAASLYARYRDPALFGQDVWALIDQGRGVAAHHYVNAQRVRRQFREAFDALWRRFDIIAGPTTPIAAPRRDESTVLIGAEMEDTRMASTRLTRAIAFLGEPAISLPCGYTPPGLPIGLQVIAKPGADSFLLSVASAIEKSLNC